MASVGFGRDISHKMMPHLRLQFLDVDKLGRRCFPVIISENPLRLHITGEWSDSDSRAGLLWTK